MHLFLADSKQHFSEGIPASPLNLLVSVAYQTIQQRRQWGEGGSEWTHWTIKKNKKAKKV